MNVRFWPLADIRYCAAHVRYWGQSRHDGLPMSAIAIAFRGKADIAFCAAYVRHVTHSEHFAAQNPISGQFYTDCPLLRGLPFF